ncbi:lycopene cyclase domain-containing protein [Microbacterium marinilacus]|uniref:Lycopene cyclase domain-containing protein n=1 Tax=Microbacterium marinilacus TaxID=415209 RepID=A0ABP7BI70_9MICO|nr:lycopene cyclase domain-containing protein [Microbacterium marinilacus]MBY0687697.1 lycopene cyclase domain-containing protein [Microbacterium marinilacus]
MTYAVLCAAFLALALAAAVLLRLTAPASARPLRPFGPQALAAVALIVLTAVFDNAMIAAGLFAYDDARISGLRVGAAPIEDFAYPLAAVILLPEIWRRVRLGDPVRPGDRGPSRRDEPAGNRGEGMR